MKLKIFPFEGNADRQRVFSLFEIYDFLLLLKKLIFVRNHNILPYTKEAREYAFQLRKEMTPSEKIFWSATKKSKLGVVMRRQMPILDYVVDFYIKEIGLAIEIDGNIHDNNILEDGLRQARIEKLGVKIVRFTNQQISCELPTVLDELKKLINEMKD